MKNTKTKKTRNRLKASLCLLMLAALLAACGAEKDGSGDGSDGGLFAWGSKKDGGGEEAASGSHGTSGGAGGNAADSGFTWGAANGLSGTVQMEYDGEGNRTKAVLINGATGNPYRTLEYLYEDGLLKSVNTYNANGALLYRYIYVSYYDPDGENPRTPCEEYGYEADTNEATSSHFYNRAYQPEKGTMKGRYIYADYWWMREHDEDGNILTTRLYFKDYFEEAVFTFNYEKGQLTDVDYVERGLYKGAYAPAYDSEGRIVSLSYTLGDTVRKFIYDYDSGGNLTRLTKDFGGDSDEYLEFQYTQNGLLSQCHLTSEGEDAFFYYDDKGNVAGREGFVYTLGGGDIGAEAYEYYDNGMYKKVKQYHSYTLGDEDKVETVYEYHENGAVSSLWSYRPSYDEGYQNFYNEEGALLRSLSLRGEDRWNMRTSKETTYDGQENKLNETSYREDGSVQSHEEWTDQDPGGWKTSLKQSFFSDGTPCIDGKLDGNVYSETWYYEDGSINQYRTIEYLEDKYILTQKNENGEVFSTEEHKYKNK